MAPWRLFLLAFVALASSLDAAIAALGEADPGAYVAVTVLSFYIAYALANPGLRGRATLLLHALMLSSFAVAAALKIYAVLAG
ncbi:MAG: hypothetical protein ABWK00_02035 [Desulfurococcaceae archaeon]